MTEHDVKKEVEDLPIWVQRFKANNRPAKLEEILPGDEYAGVRAALNDNKPYKYTNVLTGTEHSIKAVTRDGYVVSMAAVSRRPQRSYDFVRDIIDFTESAQARKDTIPVLYRVYKNCGPANNAINKGAGLVSHEGRLYVKNAKKGKVKAAKVKEELSRVLDYWMTNLNMKAPDAPITGARGASMLMEQGSRQAMVEGSYIGYAYDQTIKIPSLDGKAWKLPMYIQSMSTQFIEIPEWSVGTGLEQFYWAPPRDMVNKLRNPANPEEKKLIDQAFPSDVLSEIQRNGRVLLEPERVIHVKHRGLDTEAFGESFLEPLMPDIAYMRALQQLDFVTIDSLVNRIVIIKVGSDKPDSAYHNLEVAQARVQALEGIVSDPGPNMQVLWAGPDIEVIEVGAHNKILEIDGRHDIAIERLLLAMGFPRALLDGKDATGQVWAGYEGLRETLRAMQHNWASCWVSLGYRIAANNGYDDVELVYQPSRSMLADMTAGADLALKARKAGGMSIRRFIGELGGNFEAERRNRLIEMGLDPDEVDENLPTDDEIFAPPIGMPGDTRTDQDGNVVDPDGDPGRPRDTEREDLSPERDKEKRTRKKPSE